MDLELNSSTAVFEVKGPSMAPYLKNHDILWVRKTDTPPQPGQIVLIRREADQDLVIHRALSPVSVKGDRAKQADETLPLGFVVLGVVEGRQLSKERWVSYSHPWVRFWQKPQAWISTLNSWKNSRTHRFFSAILIILNGVLRFLENQLVNRPLSKSSGESREPVAS